MPTTPNHEYNVPNEGAQDWHIPLNENFRQYDTDIEIRDLDGSKGNYEPKKGAKFLSVDSGKVYLGDSTKWVPLPPTGRRPNFRELNPLHVFLGVGRSDPITGAEAFGIRAQASADDYGGMYVETNAENGWPFYGYANDANALAWHYYDERNSTWVLDNGGSEMRFDANGNLSVSGNKNFVQPVETDEGKREVVYTATEAGTPHTEASGVATLEDGQAIIDLPDHFAWVTSSEEPIHVQTTPYSADSGGLAVVKRSPERLVVEDRRGVGDYEFSYTVKGTRDGHADQEVVREPRESVRESPDFSQTPEEESRAAD